MSPPEGQRNIRLNLAEISDLVSCFHYVIEDNTLMQVECMFCSENDYVFSQTTDDENLASRAYRHLEMYHNDEVSFLTSVSEEEVEAAVKSITGET